MVNNNSMTDYPYLNAFLIGHIAVAIANYVVSVNYIPLVPIIYFKSYSQKYVIKFILLAT